MGEFRADLHCHSHCSDGSDSPAKLLQIAREAGLKGLSITDHDTIDAYTPDLFKEAEKLGISLLTGIELSTEGRRTNLHVLGYGIDLDSSSFRTFLAELQKRRTIRNQAILKKLTAKGFLIEEEELFRIAQQDVRKKTIGRPHIAALMIQKGYVRTFQEAFEYYLKEGASCYAPGIKFTPADAIEEIHRANGKAVLAHPHFIPKGSCLREALSHPFDGIECHYGRLTKEQEIPWLEVSKKKGWIPTGGSDYHGSFKPLILLGCSWVGEAIFQKLQERRSKEN